MTEPDKMDEYKTKMPYGSRFGYRTPPPEFAKSYVEPLSPVLDPTMAPSSRSDEPPSQQVPNNLPPPPPPPTASLSSAPRQSLFSSFPTASRYNMENAPVDYDPMQMFADIALSTAPPSFMASRSQSASHAPTAALPSNLRSSSITSSSNTGGVLPTTWSADGYPMRNGSYNTAYPPQNVHAMNNDSFHTAYIFERRTSATRLEPPMKSPVMVKTPAPGGDSYLHSAPPLGQAASPRSQQLSFPLVTAGYRPERSNKGRAKKDAKESTTPKDTGTGKGAGSSREGRGSRNTSSRGRGSASGRQSTRKSRARALSPIKDIAETEKPSQAKAQQVESKISNVITVNGGVPQTSPIRQTCLTTAAIESTDPPSPSPAYSPFPSRPNSPVYEPPEEITLDSGDVIRVREPSSSVAITEHVPVVKEPENTPDAQLAAEDSVMKDLEESIVVEASVDRNVNEVLDKELASKSTEEEKSIFSKPSPDSGVTEPSQEQIEASKQEVFISEDVEMQQSIAQEMEISIPNDKTPVIEPIVNDAIPSSISPNEGAVSTEEIAEKASGDIPTVDVQPINTEVDEETEDFFIKENEDFEFTQDDGREPIFGLGDSLNNGLPVTAFDSSQEAELGGSTAAGSEPIQEELKQLSILSPSGELSREPGDPDNEICGECDSKYRDSYGFRLDQVAWIGCDGCGKWYHSHCLKLDDTTVKRIDKFYCAPCEPKYGKSTMKRTSTRATTAIDYNALHNGSSAPIKNPNDSKLHPYVAIIRDRTHTFAADTLPRLRPEQVTVEFIDDMPTGWNQPFVVPATENPAPWIDSSEDNKPKSEQPLVEQSSSQQPPREQPRSEQDYLNMSITPEPGFPDVPAQSHPMQLPAPPAPRRSPAANQDPRGSKKGKGNSPEMTLENGDFDQKEVNRIKKTLVEGEYDVKERREGADCLDMIIPKGLTVRKVGELIGAQMRVEMINVLRQSTTREDKWNMEDLVSYFESKERNDIYNCISCEVTNTPLGEQISRPEVVRKLDLSDKVWRRSNDNDVKPHVGKYVLMSVADSFTDFHIDFAGSSVFYHIYEGQKVFLVLPPTEKNLEIYEQWSMNPDMNTTFFPRLCDDPCMLVTLNKGDTMFIPSGWIHAVYTPKDSLVIGGNFLTRSHYTKQMAIQKIEVVTDTKLSQRYPKYTTLMWHTLYHYLTKDPIPVEIDKALAHGRVLRQKPSRAQKGRPVYTLQELEGLPDLCNFLLRTALISCGSIKTSLRPGRPTLTARQVDAVKRAIPPPCSDNPLEWIKRFGRWCIWKRVAHKIEAISERVPEWAQGKWIPEETVKRGPSKAELKRLERLKIEEARRAEAPRREGLRVRMRASTTPGDSESSGEASTSKSHGNTKTPKKLKRKGEADIESSNKKRGRPNKTPAKTLTGSKKATTEDSAKKRKTKGKSSHAVEGGDGEAFTLKDGSIYVAKESNLGPARAGCQNCRMKKTGCKHKAEIAELVALLEANGGVLPAASDSEKGKSKATVKNEVEEDALRVPEEEGAQPEAEDEVLHEAEDRDQRENEAEDEGGDESNVEGEIEMTKDKGKLLELLKSKPISDRITPTPGPENEDGIEFVQESSGVDSSNGQKRARTEGDDHDLELTPPKKARGSKDSVGVSGRPAGFQGRKPSCEECKALKTKCHHDTWHLAKVKTPSAKPSRSSARRNSTIMPAKVTTPGTASRARRDSTINSTNLGVPSASKPAKVSARRKSAPAASRRKYAVGSRASDPWRSLGDDSGRPSNFLPGSQGDEAVVDDEQEELEDVIVCKKPMMVTSAVKVTASAIVQNDTPPPATPALTSVIVASGPPSTPAKSIPPVALSSTNTSPLTENEFDLDLSILDELPYKSRSRSSNTPDDPTIMAPPADFDDEPVAAPATPTPTAVSIEVTPAVPTANVTSTAVPAKYPNPAYRVHKPKVTYNRNNKNYKKKADEEEDVLMEGTADINSPKLAKTGPSMSPAAEKKSGSGTSVNGSSEVVEDGDISVEELKRLGTAADFGLRRRAGS